MLWRSLVILVTLFWLVMAVLLVRLTYFPDGSQFAQMPPGAVLQMFFDRGASGKQLHLYHGDQKIGHVTLDLRPMPDAKSPHDYTLLLSGMLERGVIQVGASSINWRVSINLRDAQHWAGAGGQIRMPEDGRVLDFTWGEGRPTPEFTLHNRGAAPIDDKRLKPWLDQIDSGSGNPLTGPGLDDYVDVSAREGVIKIAGQNHKGYVILFKHSILNQYRASAVFTEEGDLALIELPDGYRAFEPNIHGLIPEEPEEPEEPEAGR